MPAVPTRGDLDARGAAVDDAALDGAADRFLARWREVVAHRAQGVAFRIGARDVTFAELDVAARTVAARLRSLERWHAGAIVEVDTDDGRYPARALGVWLAGGAVLPMRPSMLAADARLARLVEALREVALGADGDDPVVHGLRTGGVVAGLQSVHFTSGSTGAPRAVARGWRQALLEADRYAELLGIGPGDECTMLVAPAFGASTKHLLGALLRGAAQRIATADTLEEAHARGRVLYATPGQIASCAERLGPVHGYDWISMTGEALTAGGWRGAQALARADGRVLDALGGTEFGVAANSISAVAGPLPPFRGTPLPGKELAILDDDGLPVADGEPGRLVVRCDEIAEGYIDIDLDIDGDIGGDGDGDGGAPRLAPLATLGPPGARRSTTTGDVAERLADGTIRILGRAGSMLKRHGRWIDVGPLREALAGDGRVRTFAIDVAPASAQLRLWIEPATFDAPSLRAIVRDVEARLGDSPIMPAEVIALAELPRNRHGKCDLAALRSADPAALGGLVERPRSRAARVAEEILAATPGSSNGTGLRAFELESIEMVELALELGRRLARPVHLAEVLAEAPLDELRERLLRGSTSDASRCSALGLTDAPTLLLWFGEGIGSVVAAVGLECRILQWDCDARFDPGLRTARQGVDGLAAGILAALGPRLASERLVIAGYSYGALVASACAARLEAAGRSVDSLHLVDPARRWNGPLRDAWRTARALATLAVHDAGLLPARSRDVAGEPHRELRVATRRLTIARYRPARLRCPVVVHTSPGQHDDVCRRFASVSPDVTVVPTDARSHNAVVRERPQVERWLGPIVDAVRRRGRPAEGRG